MLSNIVTVAVCFLFLKQLARITFVKGTYLIPFLLLLIFLGGFAVKNSFGDMIVVLLFGALGWLMMRNDWQRPPLLLGLVLGGIADNNLFLTTKIYGMSWVTRPGVIVIGLLIAGALLYPLWQALQGSAGGWKRKGSNGRRGLRGRRSGGSGEKHPSRNGPSSPAFSSPSSSTWCTRPSTASAPSRSRPRCFPWPWAFRALRWPVVALDPGVSRAPAPAPAAPDRPPRLAAERALMRRRTLAIVGWTVGFFLMIWFLGFITASAVATLAYLKLGRARSGASVSRWPRWRGSSSSACSTTGFTCPFPPGELFIWLGIA